MEIKNDFKKIIKEWLSIIFGVAMASFAFSFFLNPKDIVIGGVSGIGIILKNLIPGYDPAYTILIINIVLLLLGLLLLGRDFFLKTAFGSILFPVFIGLFDWLYIKTDLDVTQLDMVLIVLFAAIIMGIGLGTVVRNGGTTGGTEVIQKILFRFFHMPYSLSLYILDGVIIILGLIFAVTNLETFLYAIVFTYLSGAVVDAIVFAGFNKRAVCIISDKYEEIREVIINNFERGLTSIKIVGEYSKNDKILLLCVLPTNEYFRLRQIVEDLDKTAFLFAVRASEVRGEGFTYD